MPTRSGAVPGGGRDSGPLSLWVGTSGNRVGVDSFPELRGTFFGGEGFRVVEGRVVAVAIARLGEHEGYISLFVRFCQVLFSLCIRHILR